MRNNCWLDIKNTTAYKNDYKVIKNLSIKLFDKERIIILGPNGAGKSAIVDLINRNIYPIVKKDSYFRIFNDELIDIWKVRKYISTVNNEIKLRINKHLKVRDILGSFLFSNDDVDKKISVLSGGERARVSLCKLLLSPVNFLIMDEPTNHLDLPSKENLEIALKKYNTLNKF